MIIYFYLFVTFLYVLTADSVSVRGRNVKNDLVPLWSSRLESLRKDANSLKVLSNEPFVIQFGVPPSQNGDREDKGRDKKRRRLSKKRFPKLKSLRKKHRIRRDVQIPVVETFSGYRKPNRPENALREGAKPKNSTNHIYTVHDIKTSARQKELMRNFAQVLQKEKSNKHKEPKSLKKDDGKNSLERLRQKPDNSNRISHRYNVPAVRSAPQNPNEQTSSKYTSRDLKADRERVEDKMKLLTNMLSSNDTVGDGPRVRRKAESDRVVNNIAKMFLTLSAMNGMHDKRKSKCEEEEEDEDDVWTQERRNNPTKKNLSTNEERYKFKKWIEQMKSKRTSRTCPCMTQDYDEDNDIFPLERKLYKDNPPVYADKSSEEVSSEGFREKNFFFRPSTKSSRNFLYRPRYTKPYEDLDKKLGALSTRGRRKLELPMEDLELYRSRAKQILQNAEDILDKIKEEEEKRQVAPNVLLSQLKELTSRIQPDPRNNENDLMRLIHKNLGLAKAQDGLDLNSISDNLKSFLVDPYEKAKALTDESTKKLSSYILKNFGKLNVSGGEGTDIDKKPRQGGAQIYQGQEPQHNDGSLSSDNLEKEPEKVSVSESVKPDIEPVTNFGEKKTDGVPEDATQDPIKQRIDQMLREQEEKIRNYTESPELSEGAEEQEKVAAQPDGIVDGVTSPIEGERDTEKDFAEPTTSIPEKPGDSKDEVQGKISGSHSETQEETLKSVKESNLDDLTKSSETEGVTVKTVRESNLEDLNTNDGEDRQEGNFSERDENDVTASKYLQQPDYLKELENDEQTQTLQDAEKALKPIFDDKLVEILSESISPEELRTNIEETLEAKHATEETGKKGQETEVDGLVNPLNPETTADSDRDVIVSKYLLEEEVPDKPTEESQEVGIKEELQKIETEKPEDVNEKTSKENVGEILEEDPFFMDPKKKSKVENTELSNDEILEKSLKEGETYLSEVEDRPNEEQPEGFGNEEGNVIQIPAENPTESISEEQQDHFFETLMRKLEDKELEDKALDKTSEDKAEPEKIEDKDIKNEDETMKVEEDTALRSANPGANPSEKEYKSLMEEAEDLLKMGKFLEKLTDEAELGLQEDKNYNDNENGESQVRTANPSQEEENLGEVEQKEVSLPDELPNLEESVTKDEGEKIPWRAENPTEDEAEDQANIDENLNGDDAVLQGTNTNADREDSVVKIDKESPSKNKNLSEESNKKANGLINTDEESLKSANPVEGIEAEVKETNVEDEAFTHTAQLVEAEDEATNVEDETPLQSAHQEPEVEDEATNVEDETPLQSAHQEPEVQDEATNVKDETTLQSAHQEPEVEDENTNVEDETPLQSAHQEPEVEDEATNVEDETPLQSAHQEPEVQDEATNVKDETPLRSAHQEPEVEDENTNVEDETPLQSAHQEPEVEDEATNVEDETPLQSAHQEPEVEDENTNVEDDANIRSAYPSEAENEENQESKATLRSEKLDQKLKDGEDTNKDDYTYLEPENLGVENGNSGDETFLRTKKPNEDIEGDRVDTMVEANPEVIEDGAEERLVSLEANNQVAEEIADENDETLLKATFTSQDPENEGGFEEAVKASDPTEHSKKGKIFEYENREGESVSLASEQKEKDQKGLLKVLQSIDYIPVPSEIGDIMKDIEGSNDEVTFKSLNPEHIDRLMHQLKKVEQENVKEVEDEDCMKKCGCSESMHLRSRNLGKYEIVKDFLYWVKHIQLSK